MVAASNSTNTVVEHVFLLFNALQHGGNTAFRDIHCTYHLRPLLTSLLQAKLQMLVQVSNRIDWLLLNAHTESYVLADSLLNHGVILWMDRHIRDSCRY